MVDWIGKTLGKVQVELLLARGGMAEVYLGTHTTLRRPVAVKLLRNQYMDDPDLLDRFQREARAVASLRHPNIVQVFDFDTFENQPYIVMEYVPGVTLSTYLQALHKRNGRLELPDISNLLDLLAGALEYAHQSGIIHRDVKPGNILLTSRHDPVEAGKPLPADVQPVLTDFGLVRQLDSGSQTTTGQIAGTPAYMSPEQARGDRTDARTDIYSLGIVLYEMLAGRPPFEAGSSMGIMMRQINEAPEPIPGLPEPLQKVLDRVLSKSPADRFQSPMELARAFRSALRAYTEALTLPPARNTWDRSRFWKKSRLRRAAPKMIAAIAVIAGVTAFFLFNGGARIPVTGLASGSEPASQVPQAPVASYPTADLQYQLVGTLRLQDGTAIGDKANLTAMSIPPPPPGSHYEVWLLGQAGESQRSVGRLVLNTGGQGSLTFVDAQGRNLIGLFDALEITIEPEPDPDPAPSGRVAYQSNLPPVGLAYVRELLVSSAGTPNHAALVQGLLHDATLLDQLAHNMLDEYQTGRIDGTHRNAELMLNLLAGSQGAGHRDWDKNGSIEDPGDGFGMLANGSSAGYIAGTYAQAAYAATSDNATQNMIVHGVHVEVCAQNLEQWTPSLQNLLSEILAAGIASQSEIEIRQAVALSGQILNGTDLNGNELVEPIPGEGGAITAYQHAYYMFDIPIYAKK
jgi:serine/threonine protein kinase